MSIDTPIAEASIGPMANAIRALSMDAVQAANSGHPGMPMGMAEVATVLWGEYLKFDPSAPDWMDRDRFVLSAGHGSMLIYSLLHLSGYANPTMDEISRFRQLGSPCAGHPENFLLPGVECTTGPLGQGLAMAVGMAMAERHLNAKFGDGLVDHRTWVIAGDGCLMEGVNHEAIGLAGHLELGRLIVFWDDNNITIDGAVGLSSSEDIEARYQSAKWHTVRCDGHDAASIRKAIDEALADPRPSLIACKTEIGHGAPNKGGSASTHGSPLGDEEIAAAREKMGWSHPAFEVPAGILDAWRAAGSKGADAHAAWDKRLSAAKTKAEFERMVSGKLADGWKAALDAHKQRCSEEKPGWATRQASGEALKVLTEIMPELIGGSADLTGSVNTKTPSTLPITPDDFSGRYVHYGVREHGMAAVMNGIALHGGFIPYGGTFLVFADYMKGAMRLSSLMNQRVVYVLTHDSIGLGEDGPTHQPVETLAMLRAMPNFRVFRPCDAVETAECWALALESTDGPSGMVLTRQGVPLQRTEHTTDNLCARGGYVLAEAEGGERKVTLMATGSEVQIAQKAREMLQAEGLPTAVVSMPCWELFDTQSPSYRKQVLGEGALRVAVEAGVRMGWDAYVRPHGGFVGMTGFGASAPAKQLYEHFGITAENVVKTVKERL